MELRIRLVGVVLQEVKERGRSIGSFVLPCQHWSVSYQRVHVGVRG